jgi:NADH dehydrogenase
MILVTGGTGFIGGALLRRLAAERMPARALIRPSPASPHLPKGVPVEVAVSSLDDERGLRAAMVGVDTVYHLVTGEWKGPRANLGEIDVQGTRAVIAAAEDAGVKRFFYVSHLGADRGSAYTVLRAKGIAEELIRKSKIPHTILRTGIVFGPNDGFTTGIARILSLNPFIFLMPSDGSVILQPMWVDDLVTCLVWALQDPETANRTYDIGGPEYLSFRQIVELVMKETRMRRLLIGVQPPVLRWITMFLETVMPNLPVSVYWLDYMAVNRTTAIDTMPRFFNLMPSRMSMRLGYLGGRNWRKARDRRMPPKKRPAGAKTREVE